MQRLAIITTHPIQYNAPLFRMLSERSRILIKVFYTWENSQNGVLDKNFGKQVKWDIPLLEAYEYQFCRNTSNDQGSHHWRGIVNPTLIKDIENWRADAVLIYGWNFQSHFKAMRYFKGKIPVFFRGDSTLLDEKFGIKTILRRILLTFVYKYIDYALYVGTNNKHYYLKHGVKREQLIFAAHSVDNQRFIGFDAETEQEILLWRKELGISNDDIVFLFAGKFEQKKNPILLLQAAEQLQDMNLKFIFAGSGILENALKLAAKDIRNVIFLPFQNQSRMPILYRLADVYVLPSKGRGETWGLAINEAMACKRAILASTKVGCAVDLVQTGKNGYIFESENLSDLVNKIKKFNKQIITEMGENSQMIIEKYNFSAFCNAIESKLQAINE